MSFETFLDTFPPPWKADEYAGVSAIVDSKGNEVDTALRKAFANFVVELVNTHADAIARKDALLAEWGYDDAAKEIVAEILEGKPTPEAAR